MGNLPSGPYFERRSFQAMIEDMKNQEEYIASPLRAVHEVIVHSFIHPKDPNNPSSISTGVLTGGDPLWAFTVDDGTGYGDLYYYVYDTKVIEHREDGTWVVEHKDLVLVKAQLGVSGYTPNLKNMYDSAAKFFGGYTKFTPGMIHRASETMLKFKGCLHAKQPDVTPSMNFPSTLVDVICDHRIQPPMTMPLKLGENEKILQAGLSGRLIDYYPRVEFIVWRKDLCPELDVPATEHEEDLKSTASLEGYVDLLEDPDWNKDGKWPLNAWPIADTLFVARELHEPDNKTQLIDNEAYLQGWSDKLFSSAETRKMREKAMKKGNKFKGSCVSS